MHFPHFEAAVGAVDGLNTTFSVSLAYRPGSLAVFVNDLLLGAGGWTEVPPTGFDLSAPPHFGDVVQAFFLSTVPAQPGEEITQLRGMIDPLDEVSGVFQEVQQLHGILTTT